MDEISMAFLEYLRKMSVETDQDFLREAIRVVSQGIIEAEAEQQIGAQRYERTPERTTYRNGSRERVWETRVGEIPLRIPKLREGAFFPSLLEPRRRSEKALLNVIQTAYVKGVSTRKVDALLKSLGLTGIDKSRVSRICKELDEVVTGFRQRALEIAYPYLWLDATYVKVRQHHRIVSMALVIAIGVRETGEREVLGFEIGASEQKEFWKAFLRSLVARGLGGVCLVISDAHQGLKEALAEVMAGTSWQRCRVRFMRNVLAHIPKGSRLLVASALRTIFAQPHRRAAGEQLQQVVQRVECYWPRAAEVIRAAEEDVLSYMAFPNEHWQRIHSTNPLERVNRELKRRADVVGIFPDTASVLRLLGTLLIEQNDEWQVGRRYFSKSSMKKLKAIEAADLLEEPVPLCLAPIHWGC